MSRQKEAKKLINQVSLRAAELTPSKEAAINRIGVLHQALDAIAQKAGAQLSFAFDPTPEKPIPANELEIAKDETTAAFWSHHIGSEINGARQCYILQQESCEEQNKEGIRYVQRRAYHKLKYWEHHPNNKKTELEQASSHAFEQASFSFLWEESIELFAELDHIVTQLGECYVVLEGGTPVSVITQVLREFGMS